MRICLYALPETPSRGWGLVQEMIQVCDYDILIVLVKLHMLISDLSASGKILEFGHFEVGNFGKKLALFSTIMFFLTTGGC